MQPFSPTDRSLSPHHTIQPGQILYLEHQKTRLYTETIQIVVDRQLCWARPLALVTAIDSPMISPLIIDPVISPSCQNLVDLRDSADLLLPLSLFQIALDTEVLPILSTLHTPPAPAVPIPASDKPSLALIPIDSPPLSPQLSATPHLQTFIRQLCQAYPEAFRS